MSKLYDLVIIGAGPAGLSAAIYAGRSRLKTLVLDKDEPGGQIKITSDVANYPGLSHVDGKKLGLDMKNQAEELGAKIMKSNVVDVALQGDIKKLRTDNGETIETLGVLIATGANPRKLGFKGEEEFTGRGVGYCATCDGEFFTGKDIFVIGGGFAAAEESLYLTRYAKKIHIIIRGDEFSCSKSIADRVMQHDKIEVHFHTELVEAGGDKVLKFAKFVNNETKEAWQYDVDPKDKSFGIFVFIGYVPVSGIFKEQVTLDEIGYIVTNEEMRTNIEGVYAAGDIRPKKLRQLVTAVSDGALSAVHAEKYIHDVKEALGLKIEIEDNTDEPAPAKSIIDDDIRGQLSSVFEKFENKVTINAVLTKSGDAELVKLSDEMKVFLEDITKDTDKVDFKITYQGDDKAFESQLRTDIFPLMAILNKEGNYSGASFSGIPGGHEFNSFILSLYNVAGPGQAIDEGLLARIKKIDKKIDIKVCVTLYCTYCPDVVQASQYIAINNPNITAQIVDLARYAQIRVDHDIMSVPAIIIGDEIDFGARNLQDMVERLEKIK